MDDPAVRTVHGRAAKQERSERTRAAIVVAVVSLLAEEGVAGLTHRLVAQRSGASLAATTYYFASMQDMIAEASNELLRTSLADMSALAEKIRGGGEHGFRRFVARLAANGVGEHRERTLAWCEILLDGARRPDAHALNRKGFERLVQVWTQIARAFGVPYPAIAARSGLDIAVGAFLHGLALELDPQAMWATLGGEVNGAELFPVAEPLPAAPARRRLAARAAATRERILEAAIRLLATRGAGAVNYRLVALEAGLTAGAPAYHFPSIEALLAEAEALLLARWRGRHREVMDNAFEGLDQATMVELAAVIFQSEATEFGLQNLATYGVWLQSTRAPELRAAVHEALADLYRAWGRNLLTVGAVNNGAEPLLVQYLLVGGLVRAMAAGVTPNDLVKIRWRLKDDLNAMVGGRHWVQAKPPAG
ncbi:MAG TPA: TetR family transcriptional regulator [Phenylobacterium sp.]|uniref:TetR family transcriptional regulator n=1 Tax=Phenylobacterium sp. TaxID=1871053 RepID=UPI002B46A2CE|nr:TetR family transcriptional regulator [Phenylobacterium sp.]HKR87757.1 TetR family transcriptional regulator [Phenylobacterium sp.]